MIFRRILRRKLLLFLGDIFIIVFSINLAFKIRLKSPLDFFDLSVRNISFLLILAAYLICFYIFDLYDTKQELRIRHLLGRVIGSVIFVSLFATLLFYITPYKFGRGIFLISLTLIGISVIIWRLFFFFLFRVAIPQRNLLIFGTGKAAQAIYSLIQKSPEYNIVGFLRDNPKKKNFVKSKILGDSLSLEKITSDYKVDDIVVTVEPTRYKQLNKALLNLKMRGVHIYNMPTFYERLENKLPISYIGEKWFLYADGFERLGSKIHKRIKRISDLLISLFILFISFPLGLIISLSIKLSSKGPIFLLQERIGQNYRPFRLVKFRTMVSDAECGEPKWADEDDPRVTRIGGFLRKTRLDELPQLINVIRGEMSLIGPRPEREFFIKKLIEKIPHYSLRFSVKPGLTGWAQVNYKYGATDEDASEKLQYELYYIKNMSLFLDFRILLKTIRIIIFGMGR